MLDALADVSTRPEAHEGLGLRPGQVAEGTRHLTQVVTASADSATARSAAFHATDAAVHVAVADSVTAAPDGSTALRIAQVGPESLQDVLDQIVGGGDTAPTDPA